MTKTRALHVELGDGQTVSALLSLPVNARSLYVFAHGAGAGMDHSFMRLFAEGLAAREVATLRYQFPFMQHRTGRPDRPSAAQATVRAAVAHALRLAPDLPLYAGGKSFGARMTSQAQALLPLPGVRGLIFVGFPLHPAGTPSVDRATHLADVACPMLFLQGTRDALASLPLIEGVVADLGARATLRRFDDADHAFHVRKSSGSTDDVVREAMLDAMTDWISEPPHLGLGAKGP